VSRWRRRLRDSGRLVVLSLRLIAGRRYWIAVVLPLIWLAIEAFWLLMGWREQAIEAVDIQNVVLSFPLTMLAIGLGVRVIAGEIDRRTLEIAYTVPGGAHRLWLAKLTAAVALIVASELLLAGTGFTFFTSFPPAALYGALQACLFYLVTAMAFAALFASEVTGAMAAAALLVINGFFTGFGENQVRVSPFFNPLAIDDASASDVFAWTLQNRIGFALAIAAVVALAFARAERREKLLG
jgi:ABC-type transport system involved in multi-copper enzyme maturation permease subunit